ncbi:MAG: DUF1161 domain-containing protein [Xanthomonadales bacterium]|nr:DUF1161 domain-containing protein [Xanthomonadales bacterium]
MKTTCLMLTLLLLGVDASAAGLRKDCDELAREIAAKIEANGVKTYTLVTLEAGSVTDQRIVGSCDGGTRRIAYARVDAPTNPVARVASTR